MQFPKACPTGRHKPHDFEVDQTSLPLKYVIRETYLWYYGQFTPEVFQPYFLYVYTINVYGTGWFCQAEQGGQ